MRTKKHPKLGLIKHAATALSVLALAFTALVVNPVSAFAEVNNDRLAMPMADGTIAMVGMGPILKPDGSREWCVELSVMYEDSPDTVDAGM